MATKIWQPIKINFCQHVGTEVALEAEVIYPSDYLNDQAPRMGGHRCSHGLNCNQDGRPSCIWAGTNPLIDPFIEII
jgi:hypothetical protein